MGLPWSSRVINFSREGGTGIGVDKVSGTTVGAGSEVEVDVERSTGVAVASPSWPAGGTGEGVIVGIGVALGVISETSGGGEAWGKVAAPAGFAVELAAAPLQAVMMSSI